MKRERAGGGGEWSQEIENRGEFNSNLFQIVKCTNVKKAKIFLKNHVDDDLLLKSLDASGKIKNMNNEQLYLLFCKRTPLSQNFVAVYFCP